MTRIRHSASFRALVACLLVSASVACGDKPDSEDEAGPGGADDSGETGGGSPAGGTQSATCLAGDPGTPEGYDQIIEEAMAGFSLGEATFYSTGAGTLLNLWPSTGTCGGTKSTCEAAVKCFFHTTDALLPGSYGPDEASNPGGFDVSCDVMVPAADCSLDYANDVEGGFTLTLSEVGEDRLVGSLSVELLDSAGAPLASLSTTSFDASLCAEATTCAP